ncbi:MAG: IS110 family transposase, partial [Bacteroidales bacterium]|nr:IS110 family transposase [Bacteroidales bacterium]
SHLVGWAGLRPRNDETAEKIRSRNILHGNKYLRQILVEVSWVAARSEKSFLGKKIQTIIKTDEIAKSIVGYYSQNTGYYL